METTGSQSPHPPAVQNAARLSWIGVVLLSAVASLAAAPHDEDVHLRAASIEMTHLSPVTFDLMTHELDALFARARLQVVWRRIGPGATTAHDELRVVFSATAGRGAAADGSILAATLASGPAPTVWIYTPRVAAALNLKGDARLHAFTAQRALGVALGRVVAHELIHLLVPEEPHGRGVMAACVRFADLDHRRPALDPPLAAALAAAARSWHARGGPPDTKEVTRRARWAPCPDCPVEGAHGKGRR